MKKKEGPELPPQLKEDNKPEVKKIEDKPTEEPKRQTIRKLTGTKPPLSRTQLPQVTMQPAPLPVQKNREIIRDVREIRNEIREFRPNDIRDNRQDYNQRGTPIDPKNDKKIIIQQQQLPNSGRREVRNDNVIPTIRNDPKKLGGNRGRQG